MFREMRRKKQLLSPEETTAVFMEGTAGVLAVSGDDDYPYAVPISYVFDGNAFYFHCAKEGHKLDAIRRNPKASFCVTGQDKVMPEEYTTYFRSAIAFGRIRILENDEEKRAAARKLAIKYAPADSETARENTIEQSWTRLCMLEMSVEHMTGKEARERAIRTGTRP